MHWTVQVMVGICAVCVVLNLVQIRQTRTVRVSGLLVCAFWAVQELFWWRTGEDNLWLFGSCDVALWLYFRWAGTRNAQEEIIEALILPTFVCGVSMKFNPTVPVYWAGWSMVLAQMILGLPLPKWQRGLKDYTHGPMRPVKGFNRGV